MIFASEMLCRRPHSKLLIEFIDAFNEIYMNLMMYTISLYINVFLFRKMPFSTIFKCVSFSKVCAWSIRIRTIENDDLRSFYGEILSTRSNPYSTLVSLCIRATISSIVDRDNLAQSNGNVTIRKSLNCEIFKWVARECSYRLSSSSSSLPAEDRRKSRKSEWRQSLESFTFSFLNASFYFASLLIAHFQNTQHANLMLSIWCRQIRC